MIEHMVRTGAQEEENKGG